MSGSEKITIVVACDNHYLILLAALLKSIEINHTSDEDIEIWIVEDNITKKNKNKLETSLNREKLTIGWINTRDAIPEGIKLPLDKNTYPLNIYMRLFIPYFIPPDIKKVLYLDVDMLVLKDISELWNTDINAYIMAAVTDPSCIYIKNNVVNYKELNLPPDAKYFNSGLLLINTEKWKQSNVTKKVIECINNNRKYASFSDQYGLNVVLVNKWYELDPLWNYYSNGNHPSPYLIHFFHRKPFYKTYSNSIYYKEIFYKYLRQTNWRDSKPVGEVKRYFIKLGNLAEKIPLYLRLK